MLTVVTPAGTKALTTVEAVALELGVPNQETLLAELILRASATVETMCGRSFARERVREASACVLRNGGSVSLTRWPIVEIHSVLSNGQALGNDAYSVEHGILAGAFGRVVVEYTAGYALPGEEDRDLPFDIERAVIELAKYDFHNQHRDAHIRSQEVDGVGSTTFFGTSPIIASVAAALAPYRMPVAL